MIDTRKVIREDIIHLVRPAFACHIKMIIETGLSGELIKEGTVMNQWVG
jgi:hypothetical protein